MTGASHSLMGAVVGLVLASFPFLQYSGFGLLGAHAHRVEPHADHASRHGGRLQMIGDYHLEVAYSGCTVRVYTSDALRRPLRPTRASVSLKDSRDLPRLMKWQGDHFAARVESCRAGENLSEPDATARWETRLPLPDATRFRVELEDGAMLELE